ncbi:hypothetical protein [Dongia rigui]|uniref:Uncharacterized protein n=1 Tax=Dongia rigui TaxID=940149 RepID=A0ABU5E023_9PROT|nr:hypothetical protein [Dongia rigui]MDY0872931.1 hypothetical protein [Dongia rigui]
MAAAKSSESGTDFDWTRSAQGSEEGCKASAAEWQISFAGLATEALQGMHSIMADAINREKHKAGSHIQPSIVMQQFCPSAAVEGRAGGKVIKAVHVGSDNWSRSGSP